MKENKTSDGFASRIDKVIPCRVLVIPGWSSIEERKHYLLDKLKEYPGLNWRQFKEIVKTLSIRYHLTTLEYNKLKSLIQTDDIILKQESYHNNTNPKN